MINQFIKHLHQMRSLVCGAVICVSPAAALANTESSHALPSLANGWTQWVIEAPLGAKNWCCFGSMANTPRTCDLDSPRLNFGNISDGSITSQRAQQTRTVHIYANLVHGRLQRLHVFGADCPVSAKTPIVALGQIDAGSSLAWLNGAAVSPAMKEVQILPALAMHKGGAATLFNLAKQDLSAGIRRQSWFWLSQINAPDLEREAMLALHDDGINRASSESNAIIFALSQLQAPRAGSVLIAIVEDVKLALAVRKEALFWLGQLEGDQGLNYLDRMLSTR